MQGRKREGSDAGEKEGGGVMEGRRREAEHWRGGGEMEGGRGWCEVRSEEEQKLTHQGSLSLASGHHCLGVHLRLHAVDSWAFVSLHPHSFLFTGVCVCWWASAFIGGQSSPFMRGWLRWWAFMFSVVLQLDPCGGS